MRLFLRVIETPLPIVLGYPFLHQFNPLINWKHRIVQVIHNGTTHIIPVVKAYGNPHTPLQVAYGDPQAVQNAEEPNSSCHHPTAAHHGAESFIGEIAENDDAVVLANDKAIVPTDIAVAIPK